MTSESSNIKKLKKQLKSTTKELEEAVKFPQSNPHYVTQISSNGDVLFVNKAAEDTIFNNLNVFFVLFIFTDKE